MTRYLRYLPAVLLSCTLLSATAWSAEIALEIDEAAPAGVIEGARTLESLLARAGHTVRLVAPSASEAPLTIVIGVVGDLHLEGLLERLDGELDEDGFHLATDGDDLLVVAGGGATGALYGCLALASRTAAGQLLTGESFAPVLVTETPALATRAIAASLRAPGGGDRPLRPATEGWFYDTAFWEQYTSQMALWRFDTLLVDLSDPLAALAGRRSAPASAEHPVRPLTTDQAAANRAALAAVARTCARRGIRLLLGLDADRLPAEAPEARAALETALADLLGVEARFGLMVSPGRSENPESLAAALRDVILPVLSPHAERSCLAVSVDEASMARLSELLDASDLEVLTFSPYNAHLLASDRLIDAETARLAGKLPHHVVRVASDNIAPLRCCAPLFVAGCVRTILEAGADGMLIMPLAPCRFPYSADRIEPPPLAQERDWIWFESWSRYAWAANRPEALEKKYWEDRLGERFGEIKAGRAIYAALDAGGRILPRLSTAFAPRHRPQASPLLGATFEQLMVDAERQYSPVHGETPRSSILRQRRGEPVSGETFFGVLDQIVSMANTAWDKVGEAGRSVRTNREEFSRLAGDLMVARQAGLVWWDRALAAYDATAYVLQGGANHRQAISKRLGSAKDDFADLTTLLRANYVDLSSLFGPEAWPYPAAAESRRIDALREAYDRERETVEHNLAVLEDPTTPPDLARAIRGKLFVDAADHLCTVPGPEKTPRQGTWLIVDTGVEAAAAAPTDELMLEITASTQGQERSLLRTAVTGPGWATHLISLDREAGLRTRLRLWLEGGGPPAGGAVLIAEPRVVTGRLPSRIVSWALPETVTECASLLPVRSGRVEATGGLSVEVGRWSPGPAGDTRRALRVVVEGNPGRRLVTDTTVSIPPAPGQSTWPTDLPIGVDRLLAGPDAERPAGEPAGTGGALALSATGGEAAWATTPALAPPDEEGPAGWRLVTDLTLSVDHGTGAVTAIGFGTAAGLAGYPLGPSWELVATGQGPSAPPRWHVHSIGLGAPGADAAAEVDGEAPPTLFDAPITGLPVSANGRQRVLLVRPPEGGVAAWILDEGQRPGPQPVALDARTRIPDGSRFYVRHRGTGSTTIASLEITARATPWWLPPCPARFWPPDRSEVLATWTARAAQLAGTAPDRPWLTAPWREKAREVRAALARRLLPWRQTGDVSAPAPSGPAASERPVYEGDSFSIDHLSIPVGPDESIPAHLYRPRPTLSPLPLVVVIPPPTGAGKAASAAIWPALELARHGMAVLVYDPPGSGARSSRPAGARQLQPAGLSATGLCLAELDLLTRRLAHHEGLDGQIALLGLGPAAARLSICAAALDPSIVATASDSPLEPLDALFDRLIARSRLRPLDEREPGGWVGRSTPLAEVIGLLAPRPLLLVTGRHPRSDRPATTSVPLSPAPLAEQVRPYWHLFARDENLTQVKQVSNSVDARAGLLRRIAVFYRGAFGLDDSAPMAGKLPGQIPEWPAVRGAIHRPVAGSSDHLKGGAATAVGPAAREILVARQAVASLPPPIDADQPEAYAAEVRHRIVAQLGPAGEPGEIEASEIPGWVESIGGYPASGWRVQADSSPPLRIVLVRPEVGGRPPLALAASERGLEATAALPDVAELLGQGVAVCLVGLTGQGTQLSPEDLAILAGGASTTLLRRWVDDLHVVVNWLAGRADINLDRPLIVGEGAAGVAALLAAVEDERLGGLIARETICSFKDLLESSAGGLSSEVAHPAMCAPGILSSLDIDQLVCALGRRPALFLDPVDGRHRALSASRREQVLSEARRHDWSLLEIDTSRR